MKSKFKAGDRVVIIMSNSPLICVGERGRVVDIALAGVLFVASDTNKRLAAVGERRLILEEIWDSPLYQAMREK